MSDNTDDFFNDKIMDLLTQLGNIAPKQNGKTMPDRIDNKMMEQIQIIVGKISDEIKEYDRQNSDLNNE